MDIKSVDFNTAELKAGPDIIFTAKSVAAAATSAAFYLGDVLAKLEVVVKVSTAFVVGTSVKVSIIGAATNDLSASPVELMATTKTAAVAEGVELLRYVIPKDVGPYLGVAIVSTGVNTGAIDAYVHMIAN